MKLLFLRGQVPSDRPKEQIMFNDLFSNDDMWTWLAYELVQRTGGYGEIWFEKGDRVVKYTDNFVDRWVPRYISSKCGFEPDVVFARGGFGFMREAAKKYKNAFKIHYGAGKRVVPKFNDEPWDIVLADTAKQMRAIKDKGYTAKLFIKPASENIFFPVKSKKKYDVIYVANWNPNTNKGHRFILPAVRDVGLRVLHVGVKRPGWDRKYPNVKFVGRVPRREIPELYAQSKVAIVRTVGKDSCPRVIPEAIACDCPILVDESTNFCSELYLGDGLAGRLTSKQTFTNDLNRMIKDYQSFQPALYYKKHLSMRASVDSLLSAIG